METVARTLYDQVRAERDLLADEIEYLRGQLADRDIVFPARWTMSPSQRTLLRGLMRRTTLSKDAAMALLYSGRGGEEPHDKIIDVFICRLRAALKPDGITIKTQYGEGFYLAPEMKARIQTLCEQEAASALNRAGAA
jgi:DNA-binding response OmpR family regulator